MEQHLLGNARIQNPCQDIPPIGGQCYEVYLLISHELFNSQKQISVIQHGVCDVGIRILPFEVFAHPGQSDLIPFVPAGRDIKQVDMHVIPFNHLHETVKGDQITLTERSGKRHMFHRFQVIERNIFRDSQHRDFVHLNHLARNASYQINIFLVFSACTHHNHVRTVLFAVCDDFFFRKSFPQRVIIFNGRQVALRYSGFDFRADMPHVALHTFDHLPGALLIRLVSQGIAQRDGRRIINAVISMHDHHFGIHLMRIIDCNFTRFHRIIREVNRDQYPFLMRFFFFFFCMRFIQPFGILYDTQRMRQVALLYPDTDPGGYNRLYLIHIMNIGLYTFSFKHHL